MTVKITTTGKIVIDENINRLKQDLKTLREEKNIAYTLCGDTWHDNPHFNKLEQDERILDKQIQEIEKIVGLADIIEVNERNVSAIDIGSIALCYCVYPDFTEREIYEIVGYGESNIEENKLYYDSPVAKSLMGLTVGDETTFDTPAGPATYRIEKLFSSWEEASSTKI